MIGIYLSGTGNTKHCVEKLVYLIDDKSKCLPLEHPQIVHILEKHYIIVLGYPTQFSNAPFMVRDFIKKNSSLWKGKKVFCVNTMGLFSGDGTGCTARILKKYGAEILGGLQIKMPDSVCDSKLLKKDIEENRQVVKNADKRIEQVAEQIRCGKYPQEGLSFIAHIKGLFGQRLWFYHKTLGYTDKLKISDACIGCGLCSRECPMGNIKIKDKKAVSGEQCTMCYRCISLCPQKAITLLGDQVIEQCRYEKYK
ncbi:EFR1 family ferrodoxin [Peptoniphilus sp. oral taxon 386]|uniref:EFR1 family ferrodoxin n=1 Tax=Peptoniphilus sp. oral taxon 386 TaxID=652713 RepID=UPI0001DA9B25|nr:EFR1 family ferrodoxin [Peptoniphilus sp. oral taxon 386]EFI42111.1 4Fe-4S binding domain protein [Peptoniphilus sp. oral taxon 386 str. F0131]